MLKYFLNFQLVTLKNILSKMIIMTMPECSRAALAGEHEKDIIDLRPILAPSISEQMTLTPSQ